VFLHVEQTVKYAECGEKPNKQQEPNEQFVCHCAFPKRKPQNFKKLVEPARQNKKNKTLV